MSRDWIGNTIYAGVGIAMPQNHGDGYRPNEAWLADMLRESKNAAGVAVNLDSAVGYAPVWSCLNKIAGHCGYLPVSIYEKDRSDPRKRREATKHPVYWLLSNPNSYMTGQTLRETLTWHALLGNGRALIVRNGRGEPAELLPLPPKNTKTILVRQEGLAIKEGTAAHAAAEGSAAWEKWHCVTIEQRREWFRDSDVLHIPGLGYDGICGYSVVDLAKQSLGLGMVAEKAVAQNFKNGARPSFLLKAPPGMFSKAEDAREFIQQFNRDHAGDANEGRVGLLRNGVDVALTQNTPRDAEWIEQRKFQRQEVALWFAVERILGDDSTTSYNSLEETNRAYVTNCLTRWLTKWETEMATKLLTTQQRYSESHYFRFTTAALLRGTTKDRYEVYSSAIANTILSPNECRELEDMPPREGGDEYRNPNITPDIPKKEQVASNDRDTEGGKEAGAANRAALALQQSYQRRMEDLIDVEVARVRAAAEKPSKFLDWVESFYSLGEFGGRIAKVWRDCGALGDDVNGYVAGRVAALLGVASEATADEFAAAIHQKTEHWRSDASVFARQFAKEVML